jgi:hypothetical protein
MRVVATVAPSGGRAGARQVVLAGRSSSPHGGAALELLTGALVADSDEEGGLEVADDAPDDEAAAELPRADEERREDEAVPDDAEEALNPDEESGAPDEDDDDDEDVSAGRGHAARARHTRQRPPADTRMGSSRNSRMRHCDQVTQLAPARRNRGALPVRRTEEVAGCAPTQGDSPDNDAAARYSGP